MAVWVSARCEACGLATLVEALPHGLGEQLCEDCGGPVYLVEDDHPVVDGVELATVIDPSAGYDLVVEFAGDPGDCDLCAGLGDFCTFHTGWIAGWAAHDAMAPGGGS